MSKKELPTIDFGQKTLAKTWKKKRKQIPKNRCQQEIQIKKLKDEISTKIEDANKKQLENEDKFYKLNKEIENLQIDLAKKGVLIEEQKIIIVELRESLELLNEF